MAPWWHTSTAGQLCGLVVGHGFENLGAKMPCPALFFGSAFATMPVRWKFCHLFMAALAGFWLQVQSIFDFFCKA